MRVRSHFRFPIARERDGERGQDGDRDAGEIADRGRFRAENGMEVYLRVVGEYVESSCGEASSQT